MSTRVRLPDGSYVTVPTDDTKQAAAAARAYWSKNGSSRAPKVTQAQKDAVRDMVGPGSTGVMVDSFLPGWADEIYAAPGAALAWIKGEDAGEAFRTGQRQFRESVDGYKKRNPIKAALASGTGMAGGVVLPAGRALKGANLGRKVLQGAKVGALYGAVTGAGEGEGLDLSRRGKNAMVGGALGATVGGSLPVLSSGALAALPETTHGTWATGAGTALRDEASRYSERHPMGDTAGRLSSLLGDEAKVSAFDAMAGNGGGVRDLQGLLDLERQATLNYRGSAGRRAGGESSEGGGLSIPTSAGGLVRRFVDHLGNLATAGNQAQFSRRLGELVTETNPQSIADVVRAVEDRAASDRRFRDMVHRAGIATGAGYGMALKPSDPVDAPTEEPFGY